MGIESPLHLLFILGVALIVLGPKRLPELARAIGKGVREFRGAMEAGQAEPSASDAAQHELGVFAAPGHDAHAGPPGQDALSDLPAEAAHAALPAQVDSAGDERPGG